jgi:phytoene desaturase
MTKQGKKAVIIGSGVAGLASAIRLAKMGFEVTIFEKNSYAGGKLSHFEQDGFAFDAGPSLFTQPQNVVDIFEFAGENIKDYFDYCAVPIACTYFYPEGQVVQAYTDKQKFAKELHTQLGEKPENVLNYLKDAELCYTHIGQLFIENSLHKRATYRWLDLKNAIQHTKLSYLFGSLHSYNKKRFLKKETIQLFNRYATYNGSNPYSAPGMLSLIPHLEQNEGTFYPFGGMISITNALVKLAKKLGVKLVLNTEVQKILKKGKNTEGVIANGETYKADVVVSNMDVYFTYKKLLGDEAAATKLLRQERSSSAVIFYWGIAKKFQELGLHNIFFSADYATEFDHLFDKKGLSDDPTIYINITSKIEKNQAPEGCENWFVMVNAPHNQGQDWDALIAQCRVNVLKKLSKMLKTDISALIKTEAVLDPLSIESKTSSYTGSLYGTSSNSKMAAFMRHPNFKSSIKGLYFVGGSVHPGGGIPLCLKSAKIVASLISEDIK